MNPSRQILGGAVVTAVLICFGVPAAAQSTSSQMQSPQAELPPRSSALAPAQPPGAKPLPGPVVGGRDVQPHSTDMPGGQTDPEATELLRETNDAGPLVPPHDLYGNPLGVDTQNITTDPGRRNTATPH